MGFVHALPALNPKKPKDQKLLSKTLSQEVKPPLFPRGLTALALNLCFVTIRAACILLTKDFVICIYLVLDNYGYFIILPISLFLKSLLKHTFEPNNNVVCIPDIETHMPDPPGKIKHILVFDLKQTTGLSLQVYLQKTEFSGQNPLGRETPADELANTVDTVHTLTVQVNRTTKLLCSAQRQ